MKDKDNPKFDPKALASLLDKASMLSADKLAKAKKYIDGLENDTLGGDDTETQEEKEMKKWMDDSMDYAHKMFWETINTGEDSDMAMNPIFHTFIKHSAFCMSLYNTWHQDELFKIIEDGFEGGIEQGLIKRAREGKKGKDLEQHCPEDCSCRTGQ